MQGAVQPGLPALLAPGAERAVGKGAAQLGLLGLLARPGLPVLAPAAEREAVQPGLPAITLAAGRAVGQEGGLPVPGQAAERAVGWAAQAGLPFEWARIGHVLPGLPATLLAE